MLLALLNETPWALICIKRNIICNNKFTHFSPNQDSIGSIPLTAVKFCLILGVKSHGMNIHYVSFYAAIFQFLPSYSHVNFIRKGAHTIRITQLLLENILIEGFHFHSYRDRELTVQNPKTLTAGTEIS